MAEGSARFRFGPRDQRGLIAGVRTAQVVIISVALVGAASLVRTAGVGGLPAAGAVVLVAVAAAWLPLGRRTFEQWLPILLGYGLRRLGDGASQAATARRASHTRADHKLFEGIEVVVARRGSFGVILDRHSGTANAVISVGSGSFALVSDTERAQRIAVWSAILAACAQPDSAIHRLQWVERTVPSVCLAAKAALGTRAASYPCLPQRSYDALVRAERGGLVHELFVVVTVRARSVRDRGQPHADLASALGGLERRLIAAGIGVEQVLSRQQIVSVLHRSLELRPQALFAARSAFSADLELRWSRLRTAALWHTTYWIQEWPRHDVACDFLAPLLLATDERRSVALTMAPIAPRKAVRDVEQARVASVADADLRRRHGFALSARVENEQEAVMRRERELAEGHAGFRFSGYVTVSARGPDALVAARRRVEQLAALCHLELCRLDGQQDEAFLCTLPLGRGCA